MRSMRSMHFWCSEQLAVVRFLGRQLGKHEALTKVACTAATHHAIDALLSLLLGN